MPESSSHYVKKCLFQKRQLFPQHQFSHLNKAYQTWKSKSISTGIESNSTSKRKFRFSLRNQSTVKKNPLQRQVSLGFLNCVFLPIHTSICREWWWQSWQHRWQPADIPMHPLHLETRFAIAVGPVRHEEMNRVWLVYFRPGDFDSSIIHSKDTFAFASAFVPAPIVISRAKILL